jgi:hypothetical protein
MTGLLLALVLVGGVAGWTWGASTSEPGRSGDAPAPVAAADPSLPYTAPEKVKPDSDLPPLPEGITTHEERLGPDTSEGLVVPVPDGWDRYNFSDTVQARWTAAGNPSGAYSVRVHSLADDDRSLIQQVAQREAALRYDDSIVPGSLEVIDSSGDTLVVTYVQAGYRRLQVIRWVSFLGGAADVEVAGTGRLVDERGLEQLVARIASGVRRQAPLVPEGERPEPLDPSATAGATQ